MDYRNGLKIGGQESNHNGCMKLSNKNVINKIRKQSFVLLYFALLLTHLLAWNTLNDPKYFAAVGGSQITHI